VFNLPEGSIDIMVSTIIPTDIAGIAADQLGGVVDNITPTPHYGPHRTYQATWQSPDGPLAIVIRFYLGLRSDEEARAEAAALRELYRLGFPVPELYACVDESRTFGAPLLIMQRVDGRSLASLIEPASGSAIDIQPYLDHACNLMLRLHGLRWQDAFDHFQPAMVALDFAERQVKWWCREAQRIGAEDTLPGFDWLKAHMFLARECPTRVLVHRDFQPATLMIDLGHISGVIDWGELAIADAAVDVGWTRMILDTEVSLGLGAAFTAAYQRHNPSVEVTLPFWEVFAACKRLTMLHSQPRLAAVKEALCAFINQRLVYED
jgi:aminoglycoside phosphotransferase (APT) family kinase protein